MSACPSCGGPAQPSGRGYLCPRCGYQSGVSPAVQWLEARPINAYNASEFGPTLRHDLFDEDCDYRGGSIRGLAQIKEDHSPRCQWCSPHAIGELLVVG
jgi:hypothetical protein